MIPKGTPTSKRWRLIHAGLAGLDLPGNLLAACLGPHVSLKHTDVAANLAGGLLKNLQTPTDDIDACAVECKALSYGLAEARATSRDDDDPVLYREELSNAERYLLGAGETFWQNVGLVHGGVDGCCCEGNTGDG